MPGLIQNPTLVNLVQTHPAGPFVCHDYARYAAVRALHYYYAGRVNTMHTQFELRNTGFAQCVDLYGCHTAHCARQLRISVGGHAHAYVRWSMHTRMRISTMYDASAVYVNEPCICHTRTWYTGPVTCATRLPCYVCEWTMNI
jgi:hypothetical protein